MTIVNLNWSLRPARKSWSQEFLAYSLLHVFLDHYFHMCRCYSAEMKRKQWVVRAHLVFGAWRALWVEHEVFSRRDFSILTHTQRNPPQLKGSSTKNLLCCKPHIFGLHWMVSRSFGSTGPKRPLKLNRGSQWVPWGGSAHRGTQRRCPWRCIFLDLPRSVLGCLSSSEPMTCTPPHFYPKYEVWSK